MAGDKLASQSLVETDLRHSLVGYTESWLRDIKSPPSL